MIARRRRSVRLFSAVVAASLLGAGCDALLGFTDKQLRGTEDDASVPALPDAQSDAGSDAADAAEDAACSALGVPPRPTMTEDAGAPERTVVLAFRRIDLGDHIDHTPNEVIGLNLDGTCTCPGPESCRPYPDGGPHCDQQGAIDNEGTRLFQYYSALHGSLIDTVVNDQIDQGLFSVVIRIGHYNGEADDPNVTFGFFTSVGTSLLDGGLVPPRFDGHDTWDIDPSSAQSADGGLIPKYEITDAYVANHVLVGSLGDWPIPFGAGTGVGIGLAFNMQLTGAHVRATLKDDGAGGFRIDDGVFTGRWPTHNILGAIGGLPNPFPGGPRVCDNKELYFNVVKLVCGAADVTADPATTDPNAPCTAVSAGMRFEAIPAAIGITGGSAEAGVPCAPYECL